MKHQFTPSELALKRFVDVVPGAALYAKANDVERVGCDHAWAAVEALEKGKVLAPYRMVATVKQGKLPPFQAAGVWRLTHRMESGAMCNDDMGLGKTIQSIAALSATPSNETKVILCPASLRTQWAGEISKWMRFFKGDEVEPVIIAPSTLKRKVGPKQLYKRGCWLVAGYGNLDTVLELVGYDPLHLCIDEIHNLRGLKGQKAEAVKAVARFAQSRIGLTGSLLINDSAKLWTILDMIEPGAWGSYYDFTKRYASGYQDDWGWKVGELSHAAELAARMSYMSYRRERAAVKDQLPFDTKYQLMWLDVDPEKVSASLFGVVRQGIGIPNYLSKLAEAKHPSIVDLVKSDQSGGTSSITFTYLREAAQNLGVDVPGSLVLTGDNTAEQRSKMLSGYLKRCEELRFPPTIFGTLDSIGEGLNMQWAKVVNIASFSYTPDQLRQAVARSARMGQTGTVVVRLLGVRRSLDEHYISIMLQKLKEQQSLHGKEQDKEALAEAMGPKSTKDVLEKMYLRFLKEEQG